MGHAAKTEVKHGSLCTILRKRDDTIIAQVNKIKMPFLSWEEAEKWVEETAEKARPNYVIK